MDRCLAPDCDQQPAAIVRNEARACVEHYRVLRNRLESLGLDLAHYTGPLADLVKPDPIWAVAAALVDEAEAVRRTAGHLRQTAREMVAEARLRRQPQSDEAAPSA